MNEEEKSQLGLKKELTVQRGKVYFASDRTTEERTVPPFADKSLMRLHKVE